MWRRNSERRPHELDTVHRHSSPPPSLVRLPLHVSSSATFSRNAFPGSHPCIPASTPPSFPPPLPASVWVTCWSSFISEHFLILSWPLTHTHTHTHTHTPESHTVLHVIVFYSVSSPRVESSVWTGLCPVKLPCLQHLAQHSVSTQ